MSNAPAQTNPEVESTRRTPAPAEAARPAEAPGRPKAASFPGPICRADLPKKRGRWARLLLVLWPRATLANPVALSGGRKPVQVELRLEQVKVVRNDLSDADLEVVAAKPPPAKAPELAPGTAPVPAKHRRGGLLSILRMLS